MGNLSIPFYINLILSCQTVQKLYRKTLLLCQFFIEDNNTLLHQDLIDYICKVKLYTVVLLKNWIAAISPPSSDSIGIHMFPAHFNDRWASTNHIYDIYLRTDYLSDDFLVLHLLYHLSLHLNMYSKCTPKLEAGLLCGKNQGLRMKVWINVHHLSADSASLSMIERPISESLGMHRLIILFYSQYLLLCFHCSMSRNTMKVNTLN